MLDIAPTRFLERVARYVRMKRDPEAYVRSLGVGVGRDCRFIKLDLGMFGSEPYLIRLGDHVTITAGVRFVTHDGGVWVFRDKYPDIDVFGPIVIGNNVFIGMDSMILPGVTIGDDCVIGAGSVVSRDVPSGSVAVGTPARVVRSVAEYLERIAPKTAFIRGLPPEEKRRILEHHFFGVGEATIPPLKQGLELKR
jgi:acetyltransferase-like isoleucine patch superfamily enzyme